MSSRCAPEGVQALSRGAPRPRDIQDQRDRAMVAAPRALVPHLLGCLRGQVVEDVVDVVERRLQVFRQEPHGPRQAIRVEVAQDDDHVACPRLLGNGRQQVRGGDLGPADAAAIHRQRAVVVGNERGLARLPVREAGPHDDALPEIHRPAHVLGDVPLPAPEQEPVPVPVGDDRPDGATDLATEEGVALQDRRAIEARPSQAEPRVVKLLEADEVHRQGRGCR
mmetsp:Transcript_32722/g.93024  ORF Transcript_32722/g.93024 Transcript_32722/m.93024 type:complete len:223 (+) Transcript_32722:156-824(+)